MKLVTIVLCLPALANAMSFMNMMKQFTAPWASNLAYTPYSKLRCEMEYDASSGGTTEVCYTGSKMASKGDVNGACTLLGDYGSGTRWACDENHGGCDEEWVNGELVWTCYVH